MTHTLIPLGKVINLKTIRTPARIILAINQFSLDAPLAALAWQDLAGRMLHIELDWRPRLLLFAVTWLVYAGDRMLDAIRPGVIPSAISRHQFAVRHFRTLGFIWGIVFLSLICWMLAGRFLLDIIWPLGPACLAALLLYYLLCEWQRAWRVRIPRELVVAAFFTLASLVSPVAMTEQFSRGVLLRFSIPCFVLASLNSIGITTWEAQEDRSTGEQTLGTRFPSLQLWYPNLVLICGFLLAFTESWFPEGSLNLAGAYLLTAIVLGILHSPTIPRELKPALADLSLIIPWLIVFNGI